MNKNLYKNNLLEIAYKLSTRNRKKEYLEEYYIQTRLNDSLSAYYKELIDSVNILMKQDKVNLIKKL